MRSWREKSLLHQNFVLLVGYFLAIVRNVEDPVAPLNLPNRKYNRDRSHKCSFRLNRQWRRASDFEILAYLSHATYTIVISTSDVEHLPARGSTGLHRVFRYVTVTRLDPIEMSGHQYLRCTRKRVPCYVSANLVRRETMKRPTKRYTSRFPFRSRPKANRLSRERSHAAVSQTEKKLIRTSGIECTHMANRGF